MYTRTLRALALAVIAVSLSGCPVGDNEPDPCNVERSTTDAQTGASGLLLEPSAGMFLTFEEIERAYEDTEACTGIIGPGPNVAFHGFDHFGIGGYLAIYMRVTRSVWVNTDDFPGVTQDCKLQRAALKHEFVHHLLHEAGVTGDENRLHVSPFFEQCGKVVISNGRASG